jgi:hypothetical protein
LLGILLPVLLALRPPPPANALSADGLALLAFKSAVTDDPSSALSTWSSTDADPCRWVGVTCANTSSGCPRVVGVSVAAKNLSGHLPSELGSLPFLRRLNLHGNRLSGAVPPALANATSLRSLFIYDNSLTGPLPAAALCALPRLQNLDLSGNALSGALPPELARCGQLQRLLLADNGFSGTVPAGVWSGMAGLQMLDLSGNNFSGVIPVELGKLPALAGTLNLSRNHLSGGVPAELGRLPATVTLDLRFNNLSGEIPQSGSLASQGPTAFLNNPGLCGFPLQVPCRAAAPSASSTLSPPATSSTAAASGGARQPIRTSLIVLISVADAAGVALIGVVAVYVYWKVRDRRRAADNGKDKAGGGDDEEEGRGLFPCLCPCMRPDACTDSSSDCSDDDGGDVKCSGGGSAGAGEAGGVLVAIDKGFKMELDELLRSSAYVLGKGGKGIVYKVVVGNGTTPVAVRRLGGGAAAPERYREFAAEAGAIGRVRHPNVVRLRAYYWSTDEKLVVTDFVNNGNVAAALRGELVLPFFFAVVLLSNEFPLFSCGRLVVPSAPPVSGTDGMCHVILGSSPERRLLAADVNKCNNAPGSFGLSATSHSSTFLSQQTSHQQSASRTLLSEQTSHQPTEQVCTVRILLALYGVPVTMDGDKSMAVDESGRCRLLFGTRLGVLRSRLTKDRPQLTIVDDGKGLEEHINPRLPSHWSHTTH